MIKLYLASFLEPENFGPGRIIGIANGDKPSYINVDLMFKHLVPSDNLMKRYRKLSGTKETKEKASEIFINEYSKQLSDFEKKVKVAAERCGKKPSEILPFKDGDTLASWEREKFTNYRPLIRPVLERLGFEVVLR